MIIILTVSLPGILKVFMKIWHYFSTPDLFLPTYIWLGFKMSVFFIWVGILIKSKSYVVFKILFSGHAGVHVCSYPAYPCLDQRCFLKSGKQCGPWLSSWLSSAVPSMTLLFTVWCRSNIVRDLCHWWQISCIPSGWNDPRCCKPIGVTPLFDFFFPCLISFKLEILV